MACSHDVAVDEMVARIAPVLEGQGIPCKYPNAPDIDKGTGVWARFTVRYEASARANLGTRVRRERHVGKLFVQYMFPPGAGSSNLYTVPQLALDALVDYKSPSGVWFRRVTLLEGSDEVDTDEEAYYCVTVRADFEHDEIRIS